MKLSAPIYRLKRQARLLAREKRIPLNDALDRIALEEGFNSWSLLAAQTSDVAPSSVLLNQLKPGDLVLLGARPGHGKTLMSLRLLMEAVKAGRRGVFFTLEYTANEVRNRLQILGEDAVAFSRSFEFDTSDTISADTIIERLGRGPRGTVVVVDYLQLLDQRRENPSLMHQVRRLKSFASERGVIIVFISQIDRSYDSSVGPCPGMEDVRLPNPLDLTLFNKTCFLNNGDVRIEAVG